MKYTIETIPYTQPYHYTTLKEAKRKQSELRKQGKKSHIICVTENGNDYTLEIQRLNTSRYFYTKNKFKRKRKEKLLCARVLK